MNDHSAYIPGMCNINAAEVAYRRRSMWLGYAVALASFIGLSVIGIHELWRAFFMLLPLYVGIIGTLQVRNRFCVAYATSGMQNAAVDAPSPTQVRESDARKKDRAKARRMSSLAMALSVVISLSTLFIPTV